MSNMDHRNHPTHPLNLGHYSWAKGKIDAWALSSESTIAVEYMAALASSGEMSFQALREAVSRRDLAGIDPDWLARLARVVALQSHTHDARQFAIDALRLAVPQLPRDDSTIHLRKLLLELWYHGGDFQQATRLVAAHHDLANYYHGYLVADLKNPFVVADGSAHDDWLSLFNTAFVNHGMSPVSVERAATRPFNTLRVANALEDVTDGPLVSVVMTSFNPDPVEFRLSVASILNQTWRNLELIIVDDCSTELAPNLLAEIQDSDPRVRVSRLQRNGGTYRARNKGINAARGEFVTGQDADDWSHPERIARQVQAFASRPDFSGVMTSANRTDDRLVRMAPGLDPHRRCEASLLYRRSDAVAVGGYLAVRKGADSEFRERLEHWSGHPVLVLDEPLYMIRMTPGSLSRSDFRAGWSHHARRAFWSAYRHWHSSASRTALQLTMEDDGRELPFVVPARMRGDQSPASHFDVCFAGDWRVHGLKQREALDEIGAAIRAGLRVAVLQMESPYSLLGGSRALAPAVQHLINSGALGQLFLDEATEVEVMIIRDPSVVDYARNTGGQLRVRQCLIVAEENPAPTLTAMHQYVPAHAHELASTIFGLHPRWAVPMGSDTETFVTTYELPVIEQPYPLVLDLSRYPTSRPRTVHRVPRFGRTGTGSVMDWPSDDVALRAAYPIDGSAEVRVLGDARGALPVLEDTAMSPTWMDFRSNEVRPDVFWRTVDYAVQFDRRRRHASFSRELLEALASGAVVIMDPTYKTLFGEAVLTGTPHEVQPLVRSVPIQSEAYGAQVVKGREFVREQFSPETFSAFLHEIISTQQIGSD